MSKKSAAPELRTITITNATTGKVEAEYKDVDCAIVCASIANTTRVDNTIFSACTLPSILAVIKSANDCGKRFKVRGIPAITFADLFDGFTT